MKSDCVSEWMNKMADGDACIEHMSRVAGGNCSAGDIERACSQTAQRFTVRDADALCTGIQNAHENFWPAFWTRHLDY